MQPRSLWYLAAAFIECNLPHSDYTESPIYQRRNGSLRLTITNNGAGMPYGVYARLLLMHIMTEATIKQTPEIDLPKVRALCRLFGISSSGIANHLINEQIKRLFDCTITLKYDGEDAFDLLDCGNLSAAFFEHLSQSAVPVDYDAYSAMRRSVISGDLFLWLSHRLPHIRKDKPLVTIPLVRMKEQFGASYARHIDFVAAFADAIKTVKIFYPAANIQIKGADVMLYRSHPHVFAGLEPQTVAATALAAIRSNGSVRTAPKAANHSTTGTSYGYENFNIGGSPPLVRSREYQNLPEWCGLSAQ